MLLLLTCRLATFPVWLAARVTVVGVPTVPFTIHVLRPPVGTPLFQVEPVLKSPLETIADVEGEPSEPHWAKAADVEKLNKTSERQTVR